MITKFAQYGRKEIPATFTLILKIMMTSLRGDHATLKIHCNFLLAGPTFTKTG